MEEVPKKSYQLTVTVYGPNPNYEAEIASLADRQSNARFGIREEEMSAARMKTERVLFITLTEDEFKKVKLETLKVFE